VGQHRAPIGALSITNSAVNKHLAPPEQKHVSQVCYYRFNRFPDKARIYRDFKAISKTVKTVSDSFELFHPRAEARGECEIEF
jgi:hypothetical protein